MVIDASGTVDDVHAAIAAAVGQRFGLELE
jgi:hypothetical protein